MMEFFDVLTNRKSVRAFSEAVPEEEVVRKVLDAANQAPSAGNLQAFEIFVVRQPADRKALARAALGQDFVAAAPVSLVFCAAPWRAAPKYGQRGMKLYAVQDATIACTYAMLAATALGLATVWVGAFRDDQVRRAIRGLEDIIPVAILPVGFPAESPEPTPRRPFTDLVHEI
jgi:nitroreductase